MTALGGILTVMFWIQLPPVKGSVTANHYKVIIFILWWNIAMLLRVVSSRMTTPSSIEHEGGHWMVCWGWKRYALADTRSQSNWTTKGNLGCLGQCYPPPSSKLLNEEKFQEKWCSNSFSRIQRLVQDTLRLCWQHVVEQHLSETLLGCLESGILTS